MTSIQEDGVPSTFILDSIVQVQGSPEVGVYWHGDLPMLENAIPDGGQGVVALVANRSPGNLAFRVFGAAKDITLHTKATDYAVEAIPPTWYLFSLDEIIRENGTTAIKGVGAAYNKLTGKLERTQLNVYVTLTKEPDFVGKQINTSSL